MASPVITSVPTTAGPMPPMLAGSTLGGIEAVRNCPLMIPAPLEITVYSTNTSGTRMSSMARTMSTVMIWFLVLRQEAGSRRSTVGGCGVVAIRPPSSAGWNAPPPTGR